MKPGLRLGIDIGGTQVKLALVRKDGKLADIKKIDTIRKPRSLVPALKKEIAPWLESHKILGTGVGVAGDVDPVRGVVRFSPNLNWHNVPLKKLFLDAGFPKPLFCLNDATTAAWGAFHWELKGKARNVIVLTLGTGVGGGIIINGELYKGKTGTAGELGHINISPDGALCNCGSQGCLETYVGRTYLIPWIKEQFEIQKKQITFPMTPLGIYKAALKGNKIARQAWGRVGWALGIGLSNIINIFNPDTIFLCGGLAGASSLFLKPAKKEIRKRAWDTPRRAARLVVSNRSQHLGVIGAGLLVP